MSAEETRYRHFGIRHHGPGSARNLGAVLVAYAPDLILLEHPADVQAGLDHIGNAGLVPPVAQLVYNPKQPGQAVFVPFVQFSPEWVAVAYSKQTGCHLQAMDLPMSLRFGRQLEEDDTKTEEEAQSETTADEPIASLAETEVETTADAFELEIERDALWYIAQAAGYDDGERWWEAELEHRYGFGTSGAEDVFAAIYELMYSLRTELARTESEETLLREAYMREALRAVLKQGYNRIAIVCGAWHAPVLHPGTNSKEDKIRLKGLKKVPTAHTWIPWTFDRLSYQSGYAAGVISPAWYELLFSTPKHLVVTNWMTRAAQLLRQQNFDASSASVIEGVRLAEALAALRGHALPGIEELQEAAVTLLGGGYTERLQIVRQQLVVGVKMGEVPEGLEGTPFQQDLVQQQKRLKLKPEAGSKLLELDLRTELHLERSHLLHRLVLLGIDWGTAKGVSGKSGTFHEHWQLQWEPELAIKVIEAGLWGNSVQEAASGYVIHKANAAKELQEVSQLVEHTLLADLPAALPVIAQQLENLAATTQDTTQLMAALPALLAVMRYGNVRQTDTAQVAQVVQHLVPRVCIGLPGATVGLDAEAAAGLLEYMRPIHQGLLLLENTQLIEAWFAALLLVQQGSNSSGLLAGAATRMLLEAGHQGTETVGTVLALAVSPASPVEYATAWLDGFLAGSGLMLLHNPQLLMLIDGWVCQLSDAHFQESVPLLRRSFSSFSLPERQNLLSKLLSPGGGASIHESSIGLDIDRAMRVLPAIQALLGLPITHQT